MLTQTNVKLLKCLAARNISVVKIAIEICNNSELKREILCASGSNYDIIKKNYKYDCKEQWNEIEKKAVIILENLGLPKQLQREIIGIVLLVGVKMLTWAEYHERTLGLWREDSISFLSSSFFTSQGIIDNEKVAKEIIEKLVKDENLNINKRYKLACVYCLVKDIPILWNQVTKKEYFYNAEDPKKIKQPGLEKFWSYYVTGDIDKLKGEKSISQYRFEKALESGNEEAVKWCWQKLKLSEKGKIVDFALQVLKHKGETSYMYYPVEYYDDLLHFLLSEMKEEQKIEFFKKDIKEAGYSRILNCFLEWPYQSYFMKTAELMWEILSGKNYADLLLRITDRFKGNNEKIKNDYRDLFREFWHQSPEHYKRYVFSNALGDTRVEGNSIRYKDDQLLSKLLEPKKLTSSIDKKNIELIELILNDATPEVKKRVISSREWGGMCSKLIIEEKWELLEELIEKCTSSTEEANQFKKEFFLYWSARFYLIRHDKFFLMDEFEKWSTRSEEETKERKREQIFYLCSHGKFYNFIMEDKLEFADKFVRWCLKSEEEIKEFKKEFVRNFGNIICKDLIAESETEDIYDEEGYYRIGRRINFLGGKWEQVEMFLTWIFSTEEEISDFKKELCEASGVAILFQLTEANKWEEAETFFAWLNLSKEEITELKKRNILGDEMFNELVYSDEGDERFTCYGKNKQEVIELFLRWSFSNKETLLEFQDDFKQQFYGEMTEVDEVAFKHFDLAIEQCLSDLAEEEKGAKRKTEALDLPNKKLCSTKVDQQTYNKHL